MIGGVSVEPGQRIVQVGGGVNPYLKGALGMAAFGAARTMDSFLQAPDLPRVLVRRHLPLGVPLDTRAVLGTQLLAQVLDHRYKRLTARRGPIRALVAVEHSIITAIWHILCPTTSSAATV
ncbi:hypothetical protein [Streptomyces sp. NPDC059169]|uniref:hypothetical protein n=1 Tax=unclassified Streptomyces TaxID=2593676 RepID=UPI0036A52326